MTIKKNSKSERKVAVRPVLVTLLILIIGTGAWFAFASKPVIASTVKQTPTVNASTPLHSDQEAVQAVKDLYDNYLPLLAQTLADVGNNQLVEPAEVQVIRASEIYFAPDLYSKFLAQYLDEYDNSGLVTKDAVACDQTAASATSIVLTSKTKDSAIVTATITLNNGTAKTVPVTVDLHTLQVSKIDCSI